MRTRMLLAALCVLLFSVCSLAQIIEVDYNWAKKKYQSFNKAKQGTLPKSSTKFYDRVLADDASLQLFSKGIVDYLTNGNVQAAAQFLKINIGEEKFHLPLYIYTGTSGNGFGDPKENTQSISTLLNQLSGTLNFSVSQSLNLLHKDDDHRTLLKFSYQLGTRYVNGKDSLTGQNINYLNSFANAGLYFQTGAWLEDDLSKVGMFFLQAKVSGNMSAESDFEKILGPTFKKNVLCGYSLDMGIEIQDVINVRAGLYQYWNSPVELLAKPVVKFTINYKLHN